MLITMTKCFVKQNNFLTRVHTQSGRWGLSVCVKGIHTVNILATACSIRRQYAHVIPHCENLKYDSVSRCFAHVINAAVSHDKNPFSQSNFILVLNLDVNETSFHSISHWQSRPTSQFYCYKWYFNQSQYGYRSFFRYLTHHMCVNPQCEKQPQIDTNSLHDRSASHQLALFALCCIHTREEGPSPVIACTKQHVVQKMWSFVQKNIMKS